MLTGAQVALESLIREGVDTIFGYPGGANLWLYRYLPEYPELHHILVRHEQGGAHAADGYARSKRGSVGVVFATSGPGALNLVTGLATAYMDSVPVVAITGQVPSTAIGTDSFQEFDVIGSTMSVVKHSYLITRVEDIAPTIKEAFHIARTGRPGPVLIDFPKDLQAAKTAFNYPEGPVRRRSYPAPPRPDPAKLRQIAELIKGAKRPVILAGRGVLIARAEEELAELAHQAHIPVGWTLLGTGAFPVTDPMALQMVGFMGAGYHQQGGVRCRRADHDRDALRRPGDHPARLVRTARRAPRAYRHRPCRDRQERRPARECRRRREGRAPRAEPARRAQA